MKSQNTNEPGSVRATWSSAKDPWAPWLLPLWVLSWGSMLLLWPSLGGAPSWATLGGWIGVGAAGLLLLVWLVRGFRGYESTTGVRILRRHEAAGTRRWALLGFLAAAQGIALLVLEVRWVPSVALAAIGAFTLLVALLTRRISVFGSISIFGVILGVAALIVVQSVATGFQHEFERRVLGVYAHVNVTRKSGLREYRRFERYLRTLDGVVGASPFVYYSLALAPDRPADGAAQRRQATVLVKGIEPATAGEVIDLAEHLELGTGRQVPLTSLTSELELEPVPDRANAQLPPVIARTPDPRGDGWYGPELERYRALPPHRQASRAPTPGKDEDDWASLAAEPSEVGKLPTIFIGVRLAEELRLAEGDTVMLVDPKTSFDSSREPLMQKYRIAGIFHSGFQEYDTRLAFLHIRELQRFKYAGQDKVSVVDLRLADRSRASEIGDVLDQTIGGRQYTVLEWQVLNANLFKSIETQKFVLTVVLSLVITVASFNVLAALWTIVIRRTPEIAILMSMGATEASVARIFQFCGTVIGLAGALTGIGFGLFLCWLVELFGYNLDPEVYFIERLPVEISVTQIVAVFAMTVAICFCATIPPSLRAAKLRPVEGLRYE